MLEHYFRKPSTVDRIRANWLARQIEHYVEWMHTQQYAAHNILRRVPRPMTGANAASSNHFCEISVIAKQ
jgi:hypothetical protein